MIIFHLKKFKSLNIKKCKRFFSQYGGLKVKIEQNFNDMQKNVVIKIINEGQLYNNIIINIRPFDNESKSEFSKIHNIKKSALEKINYQGEIEYYNSFGQLMTYLFILYMNKTNHIKTYSVNNNYSENNIGLTKCVKLYKYYIIQEINYISEKFKKNLCIRPRKCLEVAHHYDFVSKRCTLKEGLRRSGYSCLNGIELVITIGFSILYLILFVVLLFIISIIVSSVSNFSNV